MGTFTPQRDADDTMRAISTCTHEGCTNKANFVCRKWDETDRKFTAQIFRCKAHVEPTEAYTPCRRLCVVCKETAPTWGLPEKWPATHCKKCGETFNKSEPDLVTPLVSLRKKRKASSPPPRSEYMNEEEFDREESDDEYEEIEVPETHKPTIRPGSPKEKELFDEARRIVDVIDALSTPLRVAVKELLATESVRVLYHEEIGSSRVYRFAIGDDPNVQRI